MTILDQYLQLKHVEHRADVLRSNMAVCYSVNQIRCNPGEPWPEDLVYLHRVQLYQGFYVNHRRRCQQLARLRAQRGAR